MNYVAKKNTQFIFYTGLISQADTKLLRVNPTIAAGDFKSSLDGAAFGNLATLPVVTPAGGTAVKFTLSAAEMNGDNIYIQLLDVAGAEWCDNFVNITTTPQDSNLVQIDNNATNGNNATLNLKKLNIVNNAGDAVVASSTGSNGNGLNISGNGSGNGLLSTGGTTGHGISSVGGNTSGHGIASQAVTSGVGLYALGVGSNNAGIQGQGGTNGPGVYGSGNGSGNGIQAIGGATGTSTGHGIYSQGGGVSGNGMVCTAVGSGIGANFIGVGTVSILATQGISGPLDSGERNLIADALLKRDMSSVTGEASRSPLNCFRAIRNKVSNNGTTQTITKEDNTTPAWTSTITTNATAPPITSYTGN